MNQNEKALAALKIKKIGREWIDPETDEAIDDIFARGFNLGIDKAIVTLESQPVAGQVIGEEVEADLKNILNVLGLNFDGPNRNENLRRLRKYAERALAVFRAAQQPPAPAVEVPSISEILVRAESEGWTPDPRLRSYTEWLHALLTSHQGAHS